MRKVKHRIIPLRPSVRKGLVAFMWLLCFFGMLLPSWAEGATWYVKEGGVGNGSSWGDASGNLKSILDGADGDNSDEIWVAAGSYKPDAADQAVSFALKNGVTLYGGFPNTGTPTMDDRDPAANVTILTGDLSGNDNFDVTNGGYQGTTGDDNSYHVVTANGVDETAVLDGFTITGGNASGGDRYGGGMRNVNANTTVTNCTFTKNAAKNGGGGMSNTGGGSPSIENCTFSENIVVGGVNYGGGGMYNQDPTTPTIKNCTFSNNHSKEHGGGMFNLANSTVTITNCTFSGNTAETENGGNGMYSFAGSTPAVTNCIFWGGDPGTTVGQISGGGTFTYCVTDQGGTGNTTADPKLGALADNGGPTLTCALGAGSSALNTGNNAAAPNTDQRGFARPYPTGGIVDMGAYELRAIRVDADALGGNNNGTSWTDAYTDLQDALADAENSDEIWVAEGTYKPVSPSNPVTDEERQKSFELKTGVALYGGFAGTETEKSQRDIAAHETILTGDLDGDDNDSFDVANGGYQGTGEDNSYHVVTANGVDETAALDGFTITGGNANHDNLPNNRGGGMYNSNSSSPTIRNCTFLHNASSNLAGGMYNKSSSPQISDCTFSENFAANQAGGVYNESSSPQISDCTFSENFATNRAGGVCNDDSSPTITNCTFSQNVSSQGGGMANQNGSAPIITKCTFTQNSASGGTNYGGGMFNLGSSPTLRNCTFSANSTGGSGGGIFNSSSSPEVTNCTFSDNTAASQGHGMYNHSTNNNPTVTNCIFWGGDPGTTAGQIAGTGGTYTYSVTDQGGEADHNTTEDPKLEALADNGGPTQTCLLGAGSSALDSGTSTGAPETDQRGVTRPQPTGGTVDMGSVEMEPTPTPVPPGPDPEPTTIPPGPDPEPTTAPTVAPTVAPTPEPTPVPVQPVDPPVIPTDTPLPEDTEPEIAVPLTVTVPPEATPEERKDALREALREALVPGERIESIVELLDIDATGQVYITPDGMDQLRSLLEDLEIPEGAENGPLAVFKASLGGDFYGMRLAGNDKTAVLFFLLPEGFIGKTADQVHVVKMLSSDEAVPFTQVFAMEDLKDTCSAVVEMEPLAGGDVLKRLLASKDLVTTDCRVALAIMDGGSFDLDGMVNDSVTDPAFVIEAEEKENPDPEPSQGPSGGGGGGCSVGVVPLATLFLALPLVLLKR